VLGFNVVDDVSIDATVERLLAPQPDDGREPIVLTLNVDTVVNMSELERSGVGHRLRNPRYISPTGSRSCGPAACWAGRSAPASRAATRRHPVAAPMAAAAPAPGRRHSRVDVDAHPPPRPLTVPAARAATRAARP